MVPSLENASEVKRQLQSVTFAENQVATRDIPKDSVYKRFLLRLNGSVVTTFASGTPVANQFGLFDNLCPRIDLRINGGEVIKSVSPFFLRMAQLFTSGVLGESRGSAGAGIATGSLSTVDVTAFPYGTTTQYTTASQQVVLDCECPWLRDEQKMLTWLDLRGVSSAILQFNFAAFSALLGYANTAPVVYTSSTFKIDITTVEQPQAPKALPNGQPMRYIKFRETLQQIQLTADTTNRQVQIPRGNILIGIFLLARDGAAGSTTTATGKVASNLLLEKIELKRDGQSIVSTTFKELQAENKAQYGLYAPLGSNISVIDGVARMNFLRGKSIDSGLDLRSGKADSCDLILDTTSGLITYTAVATVDILTQELVLP